MGGGAWPSRLAWPIHNNCVSCAGNLTLKCGMPTYLHLNCRRASCSLYGNFYVHVYLHALEMLPKNKKKENKKWRRDTKVGGDGGVFRSKAALYENGNGMGKKLGKSGRVTTHRWQSICRMPKVIRFESEIQNYSLTGTERAMPERFLKRSIFNLKTSRDPWESLVGKIASGPYLAHKRNENKIVWQLPAKRQNGKRCSAIASKLHISISNERQLAEKLLPMVAKKSAPNWKVQKVLEKLKKKTWKNSEQIHKKLVNSPYPKEAQKKAT